MKFFYTFIIVLVSQYFFGQNGTISGTVLDDANGRSLPGVNIIIKDLKLSTSTDPDGKFVFRNVAPGTYEVELSFIGFKPKAISEVVVKPNESTTLNTTLAENKNELNEVVITRTKAKTESVKSLLVAQKNNASVSDGISAETIKRTPDKTTSDVLKRISGASIQDNKFVIIRGLNDRYNVAFLNGAPLPSSEPDRKAFSFDIFPSNMLDNLVITKTASPDLPGEFAGGVIQINTKSVPDKNFQTLSVGTGVNTITTFKTQKTYKGSGTDWLGFDNGARDLPSSVPNTTEFKELTYEERAAVAKSFQSDWSVQDKRFKPNVNFQYSIGHHFDFKDKVLGVMFSFSNNQSKNYNETNRNDFEGGDPNHPEIPTVLVSKYGDKNYIEQVLTAGLANISLKFNENHTLTFKNIYSINSTDLFVERYGQKDVNDLRFSSSNVRWFTSNKIYSGQLNGEHYFAQPKIKFNWTGFYSNINRSIPNLRTNNYSITDPSSTIPGETIPVAQVGDVAGSPSTSAGGMFFSENKESISGGKIDISRRFSIGEDFINEIKMGAFTQKRNRDFFARQLYYNKYLLNNGPKFQDSLLELPDASIFNQSNMGIVSPGKTGFTLYDDTKPTDAYQATSSLNAAYIMLDNRYKSFRLVWGFRVEDYKQTLDYLDMSSIPSNSDRTQQDFLPSANLIYSIDKKQNLRLSYSKTLNRPEFRELAPFGFYDFTTKFFTNGNPDLKIASIINWDFRYELYPGKGQIVSFSYFNKKFINPIEIQRNVNNNEVIYKNAASAKNSGIELEFRTLLSSIFKYENATILDDLTLFTNLAVIKSKVDVSNLASGNPEKSRPLQGQSPYIFNAGLQYMNKDNGWAVSLNANRAGNRIAVASSELNPALWEKGRTFLDMQIAKSLYKNKLELKFNIQNLLAQDLIFYQNNFKNSVDYGTLETLANHVFTGDYHYENGFNAKDDDEIWRTKFGRTFSLTATYNF
ncbi:TonB-dependent receptor [Flavobacterium restrictum]|uniref:Outer membrane beta-barrel protein n=1 Tax=Flavobacterium restrictum TaxID=2594428 RepID=A0A553DWD1_9FLAO|nr:TonB-dependent receptor [Flavobacterium restrictum]TRX37069.1 outer membrane beta-barrel protein [Flavobacterium restrictum]